MTTAEVVPLRHSEFSSPRVLEFFTARHSLAYIGKQFAC